MHRHHRARLPLILAAVLAAAACGGPRDPVLDKNACIDGGDAELAAYQLCRRLGMPCGFEDLDDGFAMGLDANELEAQCGPARKILDRIARLRPRSKYELDREVLNVLPKAAPIADPLEERIASLSLPKTGTAKAALILMREAGIRLSPESRRALEGPFGTVAFTVHDLTVRRALNRIVAADGKACWSFRWRAKEPGYFLSLQSYRRADR